MFIRERCSQIEEFLPLVPYVLQSNSTESSNLENLLDNITSLMQTSLDKIDPLKKEVIN